MNYLESDAQLIKSCVPQNVSIPDNSDSLFLLYAVLLRSKGATVTASDVHDAWAAWATMTRGKHPSILPYTELDTDTQMEDAPFVTAIRLASSRRSNSKAD